MTESTESTTAAAAAPKKRGGGLNSMLIADLKAMAGAIGISGAESMKKAQLVAAIKAVQTEHANSSKGAAAAKSSAKSEQKPARATEQKPDPAAEQKPEQAEAVGARAERSTAEGSAAEDASGGQKSDRQGGRRKRNQQGAPEQSDRADDQPARDDQDAKQGRTPKQDQQSGQGRDNQGGDNQGRDKQQDQQSGQGRDNQGRDKQGRDNQGRDYQGGDNQGRDSQGRDKQQGQQSGQGRDNQGRDNQQNQQENDDQTGTGRNRRRRGRDRSDRNERGSRNRNEPDTTILEDDVLVPAAGILDVLDNYAFVRTSGYLAGADDVYVSLSMVRKFGLRRGDAIVGQVRQPREGERKEKFNPMVRIDAVNGADPESVRSRVDFADLTPLHPSERLRLETDATNLIGRVIDIASPIGKGQRGLIVSPAKAGKTTVLQSIANSITSNNPECHLMVVLVDERPEEVTDFQRSVKGEVISSTFDRPAGDHTTVAELAIERAKRLVELGHDVVVLLDGITRLGRAYNMSTSASGRVLAGGVDSSALHPPKAFFGAARNIEDGGSLTILATALVESGSKMDEVIFEEFKGTANMELRLRGELAEKRIFPAIDAVQSGTRHEEMLMGEEELEIVWKLRRALSGMESEKAVDTLLGRLRKSQNNIEFLTGLQKSSSLGASN
ncbi:transcription termination factor Rho [Nocardioides sp. Soil797]|nr:transcription termination factor Rho [Nocardioides sp. Soil797]